MTSLNKLKKRLLSLPNDFTYAEARSLLASLGFVESRKGKTTGSRVKFIRRHISGTNIIMLHQPHPGNVLKNYVVKYLAAELRKYGDLS